MKAVFTVIPEQAFIIGTSQCLKCHARQISSVTICDAFINNCCSPVEVLMRLTERGLHGVHMRNSTFIAATAHM